MESPPQQVLTAAQAAVDAALDALDAALAHRAAVIRQVTSRGWSYRRVARHIGISATAVWRAAHHGGDADIEEAS